MTLNEVGELGAAVMRKQGRNRADSLAAFIAGHPALQMAEILGTAALLGRCPFPSIDGPEPFFRDRPFYSATASERVGFNDDLIDREDLL